MLTAFFNLGVLVTCGVFFLFFLWLYFFFPFPCFFPLCTDLPANSLVWSVGNVQSLNTSINTLTSLNLTKIASSLYSWARSNSLSSHPVLPNSQNLSLTVRKTVQVLMYNHAWSLLWYFQILITFVEWRRRDAKQTAGSWVALKQLLECRLGKAGLGLPLAAFGRSCGWFSPFPGCRWLLAHSVGASRAKALCTDKLFCP